MVNSVETNVSHEMQTYVLLVNLAWTSLFVYDNAQVLIFVCRFVIRLYSRRKES